MNLPEKSRARKAADKFLDKVKRSLSQLDLPGSRLIVGVSGGADSVALLRALVLLTQEIQVEGLIVAHLNHLLRGSESDGDAAFVQELCSELQASSPTCISYQGRRVDITEVSRERKESIESTARHIRYEWFTSLAQEFGARWVVTGHTANDQAETVLHRLLRGTGLQGLGGIPFRRSLTAEVEVLRPLLSITRIDVVDFLQALGQPFRVDSSNQQIQYMRNRIRQELLPLLEEQYNPGIVSVLCRLANQASDIAEDEKARAEQLLKECELPRAGNLWGRDPQKLRAVSRHQIREVCKRLWNREGWPLREMGFREWQRVASVVLGEVKAVDFPGPVRVRHHGRVIQFGLLHTDSFPHSPSEE